MLLEILARGLEDRVPAKLVVVADVILLAVSG